MSTSADIISTLFAHGMIIGRDTNTRSSPSNTVLVARTVDPCTNPNCKAKKWSTHMTNNCYWPGGGKEGQFPPNFGQRNWANIVATSVPTPTQPKHFVLSAQIPDLPGQSGIQINTLNDYKISTLNDHSPIVLISQGFQKFIRGKYLPLWTLGQATPCLSPETCSPSINRLYLVSSGNWGNSNLAI